MYVIVVQGGLGRFRSYSRHKADDNVYSARLQISALPLQLRQQQPWQEHGGRSRIRLVVHEAAYL